MGQAAGASVGQSIGYVHGTGPTSVGKAISESPVTKTLVSSLLDAIGMRSRGRRGQEGGGGGGGGLDTLNDVAGADTSAGGGIGMGTGFAIGTAAGAAAGQQLGKLLGSDFAKWLIENVAYAVAYTVVLMLALAIDQVVVIVDTGIQNAEVRRFIREALAAYENEAFQSFEKTYNATQLENFEDLLLEDNLFQEVIKSYQQMGIFLGEAAGMVIGSSVGSSGGSFWGSEVGATSQLLSAMAALATSRRSGAVRKLVEAVSDAITKNKSGEADDLSHPLVEDEEEEEEEEEEEPPLRKRVLPETSDLTTLPVLSAGMYAGATVGIGVGTAIGAPLGVQKGFELAGSIGHTLGVLLVVGIISALAVFENLFGQFFLDGLEEAIQIVTGIKLNMNYTLPCVLTNYTYNYKSSGPPTGRSSSVNTLSQVKINSATSSEKEPEESDTAPQNTTISSDGIMESLKILLTKQLEVENRGFTRAAESFLQDGKNITKEDAFLACRSYAHSEQSRRKIACYTDC